MKHFRPTPWARQAIGDDDAAGIEARAASLGARIVAVGSSPKGPWTVHVTSVSGSIRESAYHQWGSLTLLIGKMLDDFRKQRDMVDEQLADLGVWTPEEILQVAAQTPGMDVRRA
jgi:hypothetical protein